MTPNKPTTLREFVKVAIRPDQIEHLNESLSFDRKNNKPRALVRVIIEAELVDKSYLDSHSTELLQKIEKFIDENYLSYCREHNGLPYCKNCGLDLEELKTLTK